MHGSEAARMQWRMCDTGATPAARVRTAARGAVGLKAAARFIAIASIEGVLRGAQLRLFRKHRDTCSW